jgi:oligoribonuclease NrnB/cAMP/cGMP phosphodiesterase (DHH superfamily)
MRLITRSDFDGLVCAVLLEELGIVDEILYVHPKDVQDEKVAVNENDVLANVPFAEGCGLWFDHHSSEEERMRLGGGFKGASEPAPSAARVIADYYSKDDACAAKLERFDELLMIVDIADSAQFTEADILDPRGWMMLAFIADPRTGLGYHQEFRISNFELMDKLPELMRTRDIEEIMQLPDIVERVEFYMNQTEAYKKFLEENVQVEGNIILLDLRGVAEIPTGNRFMEYVLFPQQNISVRVVDGKNKEFAMISIGHSTMNRTSTVDVGSLMLSYGGGGHKKVGTCQVPYDSVDDILSEIIETIKSS